MKPRFKAALFDLDDTLFDHQFHRREALGALRGLLAIDPAVTIPDFSKRPMHVLDDREPVRELS